MKKSYILIGKRGYIPMGGISIGVFSLIIGFILAVCFLLIFFHIKIYLLNNHIDLYNDAAKIMTLKSPVLNWWDRNITPICILVIGISLAYGFLKSIRMRYLFFKRHSRKRIKVNVLNLRSCEPAYEGNSDQDLANYLQNNVYDDYEFYNKMSNQFFYGQDELYNLVFSKKRDQIVFAERSDFENSSKTIFEIPSEIIYKNNKFFFKETGKLKGKWRMQIPFSELKELLE